MGRKPTGKPRGRPKKDADEQHVRVNVSFPPADLAALDAFADAEHDGNRSAAIIARIPTKYRTKEE